MIQTVSSAIVLVICVALLGRLLIGHQRRSALDARVRHLLLRIKRSWLRLYHHRSSRQNAEKLAAEAIRRARQAEGEWDGNVYKPRTFKRPPRDKMH